MDPDRWYSYEAGRQIGPVEWVALKARADTGILRREDFVWREGMTDWVRADGVDGLFELRPPPPLAISSAGRSPSASPSMSAGGEVFPLEEPALLFAGFWSRAAAYAIDTAILFAVLLFVGVAIGLIHGALGSKPSEREFGWNAVGLILFWLYFAGQESSKYQATLGKRAIGIQVTDLHGRRIDFARASGRHFGKIVSAILFLAGFVMAAFTIRKQALHDVMASCLVVRGRFRQAPIPDHEAWAKRQWGEAPSPPTDVP
jgi:uncharacterized RDD family membrane protein YckC